MADTSSDRSTAQANRQVAKLRAALRDREARVLELETRLNALENSTATQFGRVVAAAARRPGRGMVRLPRQLYRLWKRKDVPRARLSGERRGNLDLTGFDRPEDRMLVSGPTERLTIAGVFGPDALVAAEGAARVVPLLPHDAALAIDSADADLVVVDAAAGAPGGPWAYLGEPGVYDREQALATLMDAARDRGLPVVLWGCSMDVAPAPGLARIDWAATGGPGVSLRRFNPVGATAGSTDRDTTPVVVEPVGARSRVPLGVRRAADEIAAAIGARTADGDPAALPDLLRRSAVTVALAPSQVTEQLAAGALVLCPVPVADRLPDELRDHVRVVADGPAAAEAVAEAAGYDPRPALRTLFARHATPVRLARLCENLGLAADPLAERRIAVLATVSDEAAARRLAAELLAQAHRPVEAVITGPAADVAAAELTAGNAGNAGNIAPRTAIETVTAPWVAPWPATVPTTYLLDLVCAAECSGADAVGPSAADPYTFTTDIEPALVRRDLYGSAEGWAARGARLLSLDPRHLDDRRLDDRRLDDRRLDDRR